MPTNRLMDKQIVILSIIDIIYLMEYYSTIRWNKLLTHTTTWIRLRKYYVKSKKLDVWDSYTMPEKAKL